MIIFSIKICGQNARTIRDLRSNIDLNTVRELRFIATYLQITGRSNLNKSEMDSYFFFPKIKYIPTLPSTIKIIVIKIITSIDVLDFPHFFAHVGSFL